MRIILLAIGTILGLAIGFSHSYLYFVLKGPFQKDSFSEHLMLYQGVITFIIVIYNVGIYGYKIIGDSKTAQEIIEQKKRHYRLMNYPMILLMIGAWIWG